MGAKWTESIHGGEEPEGMEKGEKHTITPGSPHGKNKPPIILALKTRGAKLGEFLQPVGLKTWNL